MGLEKAVKMISDVSSDRAYKDTIFVRSMSLNKNIRTLTLDELKDFFKENDMPTFRAKQVYEWLWKKSFLL